MGLTGDFGALSAFRARLAGMGARVAEVATSAAPAIDALVRADWAAGVDADGNALRPDSPETFARGTVAVLLRSGEALASLTVLPEGLRLRLSVSSPHLRYQLTKGRNPLPTGSLPETWKVALKTAVSAALKGHS